MTTSKIRQRIRKSVYQKTGSQGREKFTRQTLSTTAQQQGNTDFIATVIISFYLLRR
jgi:hypothetical protein